MFQIKRCKKCEKDLPYDHFNKYSKAKDGLYYICKKCTKLYRKSLKRKAPKKKACSSCKVVQPISEFWKNKSQADGHQHYCKACNKAKNDMYRAQPEKKERYALTSWAWREENRDKVRASQLVRTRRYRDRHPERVRVSNLMSKKRQKLRMFRELVKESS
jgi:protein-arginine kinase activator protein McsA